MSDLFPYDQLPTPTVPDLSDQIERTTELIGRGGCGSVYKGRRLGAAVNTTPATVAIKIIELVPLRDDAQRTRRFKQITRELSLWCSIQHENILPLLGIARINGDTNVPAFVCPWMENGNAKEFCSRNPRFPPLLILYDIINGLHYLHTFQPEIVHGDIKAVNVLINNRCEACLCDFGLSRFLIDSTLWKTTATHAGGTVRWMAPELITGDTSTPTKESDIYAYAMTCYEILSGDVPFKSVSNETALLLKVMKGRRPDRMESFHSDFMWDIITRSWEQEPEHRLRTEMVLGLLRQKINWKDVEAALAKKDVALAEVEKETAVLKEQMTKTDEHLKALKEEKENALEEARHNIAEKERELNSLNVSLQRSESVVEVLENRVEWLERTMEDAAEQRNAEKEETISRLESEVAHLTHILEQQTTALSSAEEATPKWEQDLSDTNQRQHEEIRQSKTARGTSTDSKQIITLLPPTIVNKPDSISVEKVADLVKLLNARIEQASGLIAYSLSYQESPRTDKVPEIVWDELYDYIGSWLGNDLKRRSKELKVEPDPLITQITLQTGLVNACTRIINDWNPPFWIDGFVFSHTYSSIERTNGKATADAWRALSRTHMTVSRSERQETNKRYLTEVLLRLIPAVGVSLESEGILLSRYKEKVEDIVQNTVELHKIVSEDVRSMGLVTFTSPCDTLFDASEMEDVEGKRRSGRVSCTVEMGLRCRNRDESGKKSGPREEWEVRPVRVKSKVVLHQ